MPRSSASAVVRRALFLRIDHGREYRMTAGGLSSSRLRRARAVLERHVDAGDVPGAIGVVARRGEVHVEAVGTQSFAGAGANTPIAADTVWRIASLTKPVVAACAMTLVEDGTLRLGDPVDRLLPELADMSVLARPDGPLADTVAAERRITLRDLLTCRLGTGTIVAEPGTVPIADALKEIERADDAGVLPSPDEWLGRLGALPLVRQPGEQWIYNIGPTALGVLIARATGSTLGDAVYERVCGPLGMTDTAFGVTPSNAVRLASTYRRDPAGTVVEDLPDPQRDRSRTFKAPASGLMSSAADFLTFATTLLAGGAHRGQRILSRPAVTLMTTDHLSPRQREASTFFWPRNFDGFSWGLGVGVNFDRHYLGPSVGSFGWYGKYGTAWVSDPAENMTTIVFVQTTDALNLPIFLDFWTAAYQAVDD